MLLFYIKKWTVKIGAYFTKLYCCTFFQNSKLIVTTTLQVRKTTMFLLLIVGNYKFRSWGILHSHNVHAKFGENCSIDSNIEKGGSHTGSMVIS
jgi:hypothetical protein